jgi:hypothetical protein
VGGSSDIASEIGGALSGFLKRKSFAGGVRLKQAKLSLNFAEIDVWRAARQMIDLYDLDAGWRAGLRADQLYEDGDMGGYHVWVRVTKAIKDLQHIEPCDKDMRH